MRLAPYILTALMCCLPFGVQSDALSDARKTADLFAQAQRNVERARSAQDRIKALSSLILVYEEGMISMRSSLRQLSLYQKELELEFEDEKEQVSELLSVLISLDTQATPSAMIHPQGPLAQARAGMLLAQATPQLQSQAKIFSDKLAQIAKLHSIQDELIGHLEQGLIYAQEARVELSSSISSRSSMPKRFVMNDERMASLIESANSFEDFAASLAILDTIDAVPEAQDVARFKGRWKLPLNGQFIRKYNETDAAGVTRPGWVLAARKQSLVLAPWSSTIRYKGPLLDYGNVIVLEPGKDVLLVIAGLEEVYGEIGEVVSEAQVVGKMGGSLPELSEFVQSSEEGTGDLLTETLYIEIREGGHSVDPAGWFSS